MKYEKGTFCTVPLQMVKGFDPYTQTVFNWICYHSNNDGVCWPSIDILREECGIKSKTTVIAAIKKLGALGYITKEKRPNKSTLYQLVIKNPEVHGMEYHSMEYHSVNPGSPPGELPYNKKNYTNELKPFSMSSSQETNVDAAHSFKKLQRGTPEYIDFCSKPIKPGEKESIQFAAMEILSFLNDTCDRKYRMTDVNLGFIRERLRSGVTVYTCRRIINEKRKEWASSEHAKYLRPATLFNKVKFEQYLGELKDE